MPLDAQTLRMQKLAAEAPVKARAKSDAIIKDDMLARTKGGSLLEPGRRLAKPHVAVLFANAHFPGDSPDDRKARLARIDYAMPSSPLMPGGIDVDNPQVKKLAGYGSKACVYGLRQPRAQDPRRSDLRSGIFRSEVLAPSLTGAP